MGDPHFVRRAFPDVNYSSRYDISGIPCETNHASGRLQGTTGYTVSQEINGNMDIGLKLGLLTCSMGLSKW